MLRFARGLDHAISVSFADSGAPGLGAAVVPALKKKSLIVVAAASCAVVFLSEQFITFL